MLDEIFDDNEKKGQSMKASEITGDRFLFHSLPKEFQDWHTTYFILEQRGELDVNIVSKAVLNGYMWKVIGDGAVFGITTALALVAFIIHAKMDPTLFGFFIAIFLYTPWLAYTIYHFKFYALIRAQDVGAVTREAIKTTSIMFYQTFFAIVLSVIVAFIATLTFLDSIVELLATVATNLSNAQDSSSIYVKDTCVFIHNLLGSFLQKPDGIFNQIMFNEWFSGILGLGITAGSIYLFETSTYKEHKSKMDIEIKKAKTASGYPIESALDCLWKWRKDNGV